MVRLTQKYTSRRRDVAIKCDTSYYEYDHDGNNATTSVQIPTS